MSRPNTPSGADTTWLVNDRIGLFIHWGLYSLAARHGWIKSRPAQATDMVAMSGMPGTLTLSLPVQKPNVAVPIIELFLKS
ncbi:MAG TPA: hypothetical protein VM536_12080 [Chloroflexia bacterium]|nr:hypothetical protein [Chloroflexia bacterium]